MALIVHAMGAYASYSPVETGWRQADFNVNKLVKALKGDQINWYAELRDTEGTLKRNDKDSPNVALQLFGNWADARLREIDLCDVTLVPVPLSSCTLFAQVTTPIRMARGGRAF